MTHPELRVRVGGPRSKLTKERKMPIMRRSLKDDYLVASTRRSDGRIGKHVTGLVTSDHSHDDSSL